MTKKYIFTSFVMVESKIYDFNEHFFNIFLSFEGKENKKDILTIDCNFKRFKTNLPLFITTCDVAQILSSSKVNHNGIYQSKINIINEDEDKKIPFLLILKLFKFIKTTNLFSSSQGYDIYSTNTFSLKLNKKNTATKKNNIKSTLQLITNEAYTTVSTDCCNNLNLNLSLNLKYGDSSCNCNYKIENESLPFILPAGESSTINGDITIEGNNSSITSYGNLTINGNITLLGIGSFISVKDKGTITINGSFTIGDSINGAKEAFLAAGSTTSNSFIVSNDVTIYDNGSVFVDYNSNLNIEGSLNINGINSNTSTYLQVKCNATCSINKNLNFNDNTYAYVKIEGPYVDGTLCSCSNSGTNKGKLHYGNTNNKNAINKGCSCGNCTCTSCSQ